MKLKACGSYIKTFLYADDMIVYINNPKKSTNIKGYPENNSEFNKTARYKINLNKSTDFLYT